MNPNNLCIHSGVGCNLPRFTVDSDCFPLQEGGIQEGEAPPKGEAPPMGQGEDGLVVPCVIDDEG